jgi:hypothetical protein
MQSRPSKFGSGVSHIIAFMKQAFTSIMWPLMLVDMRFDLYHSNKTVRVSPHTIVKLPPKIPIGPSCIWTSQPATTSLDASRCFDKGASVVHNDPHITNNMTGKHD